MKAGSCPFLHVFDIELKGSYNVGLCIMVSIADTIYTRQIRKSHLMASSQGAALVQIHYQVRVRVINGLPVLVGLPFNPVTSYNLKKT
jgi:hypothetical protein